MISLLLSILSSCLIYVVFKLIGRHQVTTIYAITFNYITAFITGLLIQRQDFSLDGMFQQDWLVGSSILGFLYIGVFFLMAITTKKSGLSVVSVAGKMSLALPVLFIFFYDGEEITIVKILGIILAFLALYLSSVKTESSFAGNWTDLLFPLLVFLGSGTVDTLTQFLENNYVGDDQVAFFSAMVFAAAGIVGVLASVIHFFKNNRKILFKDILAGIGLGLPNYFSIYFLIGALRSDIANTKVFILNNVAIVLISTLLGILFFNEKLLKKNWIGIGLAVISIILISISI